MICKVNNMYRSLTFRNAQNIYLFFSLKLQIKEIKPLNLFMEWNTPLDVFLVFYVSVGETFFWNALQMHKY